MRSVVIERLDFRGKKAELEVQPRKYSRMLSSLSYAKTPTCFLSKGHRQGVEIYQVNPALNSVVGRAKFVERQGLSVHQTAAWCLPVVCFAIPSVTRAGG